MGRLIVCDATAAGEYALLPLVNGSSAADRALEFGSSLEGEARILLARKELKLSLPRGWRRVEGQSWDGETLLALLEEESRGADRLVYYALDEPLLQLSVTARLLELTERYQTEYTFADGYPEGVAPEILDPRILPVLRSLQRERPEAPGRDFLFRLIQHDINAFDLETEIAEVDLRLLRASLTCDSRGNYLLCRRLLEEGIDSESVILTRLPEERTLLRTLPFYLNLQVTNRLSQKVSYEPFWDLQKDEEPRDIGVEEFKRLLDQLEEFSPEATVSIGYRGEPGLHPRILDLIREVEARGNLAFYLETSGVGWRQEAVDALADGELRRTTLIVLLDAASREAYRSLRGDGFEEAVAFANRMRRAHPEATYVQATRLREYQETLEEFYAAWKEDNPIIQKYNHYCGTLSDRRVTDLSPLRRFPCWRLQRDLTVLVDGRVPRCQEDLNGASHFGNLFEESLETVWNRGAQLFESHNRGEYPDICGACDEYYSFNA
ncbi:MAG: spiro-SPASM protein [Alkalispirochaetaceae bacterium]